jgi:hypothetical protein
MRNQKQRTNRAGFTAFDDSPAVIYPSISPVKFPDSAVRKRVVVERPLPAPEMRICPYCGAKFEDYTKVWNTTYCRPSCKTMIYRLKRRTAIAKLAELRAWPLELAQDIYDERGLDHVEKLLTEAGYRFEDKQWRKDEHQVDCLRSTAANS